MPYLSPYSPRKRRSARLVAAWMFTFVFILWMTWYISTRHREKAKPIVEEFLRPVKVGREGEGADADAGGVGH
ncbi:hypothetical protein C8A03DRAFT_12619 [Achaetomium macrosporum]|uniref:Uncharacterized protein n=1 Tax=Achaetomium macrosporum TaxID=79813 RepID=A0AAN7HHT9_9PEZI|nr:hypothetical protein C8A03DRAFT_12619 [Achaetomium macrosporum]